MKLIRSAAAMLVASALGFGAAAACAGVLNVDVGAMDGPQREALKTLVNDFHAANPDVDVHLTIRDLPAYRQALPASLDGDAAPDVFNWFAGDQMRAMAQRGQLDDLSDLWKANTWWSTFPAAAVTVGGRQYALPYQVTPWGLFTRRDVLDRAGIHEPPHDLGALLAACSKLRKAGFTPIALGARDGWALAAWFDFIDMRANGYDFHQQLLDGKAGYTDSNVRRTFALWRQLVDARCFDPNATTVDERGAEAQFYAGRAGMVLVGTAASARFPEAVRPVIDYRPFPTIDAGQPPAEAAPTDTFQVAARARNKADARRFLKFAASSGAGAKFAKAVGSFPANKFAPVAGTVLDLASYKALTDAKGNVVQGLARDVPAGMAAAAVQGFQEFLVHPDQMLAVMNRLEAVRGTAYAAAADVPAAPARTRKN